MFGYDKCGKCGYVFPGESEGTATVTANGWNKDVFPTATAIGKYCSDPDTLIIQRCSKLKVEHNGIEIEFPFDNSILKSINTIEINGFKYVKEN